MKQIFSFSYDTVFNFKFSLMNADGGLDAGRGMGRGRKVAVSPPSGGVLEGKAPTNIFLFLLFKLCYRSKKLFSCRPYHFQFFKGCLPHILLGQFLNTMAQICIQLERLSVVILYLIPAQISYIRMNVISTSVVDGRMIAGNIYNTFGEHIGSV